MNTCPKYKENLPSIDLQAVTTLNAKNLNQNSGALELQMLTHLPFSGQEKISCTTRSSPP